MAALAVLLLLVAGIPAVLVVVAPAGPDVTQLGDLASLLMRPDDGTLFLAALAGVAWLAWAMFALSVAVETVAVIRGLPTPRLPGLGLPQRSAAALVGAAAVLLSASPWQSVAPDVRPVVATAPVTAGELPSPAKPVAARFESPAKRPQDGPMITVHHGDTLWALAERHLGAGTRYRDIAELNYDQQQSDGRSLTRDHWIFPGWKLRLPVDATAAQDDEEQGTYVVQKGDTLSEIAADHLGDADRYPEIARATRPVEQPNGAHLTDPDVILPGWTLRLPDEKVTTERKPPPRAEVGKPQDEAPQVLCRSYAGCGSRLRVA